MADALSPPGVEFRRVSPSLAVVRVAGAGLSLLLPAAGFAVLAFLLSRWLFLGSLAVVLVFLWLLWLIPRQVRATMYATSDSDFLVRRGIMFRRLDVVPYGRIQFVDVHEGPIARRLGIAEVQLHTASAGTDAKVAGLPSGEAAVLRDLLLSNGAASFSGL